MALMGISMNLVTGCHRMKLHLICSQVKFISHPLAHSFPEPMSGRQLSKHLTSETPYISIDLDMSWRRARFRYAHRVLLFPDSKVLLIDRSAPCVRKCTHVSASFADIGFTPLRRTSSFEVRYLLYVQRRKAVCCHRRMNVEDCRYTT